MVIRVFFCLRFDDRHVLRPFTQLVNKFATEFPFPRKRVRFVSQESLPVSSEWRLSYISRLAGPENLNLFSEIIFLLIIFPIPLIPLLKDVLKLQCEFIYTFWESKGHFVPLEMAWLMNRAEMAWLICRADIW